VSATARGANRTLRVCSLYPELMNIYADRGNIAVLRARCEWRGIGFELAASSTGESFDPAVHDLFYMGGGQDRDQAAVARDMVATKRDALHAAADRGAVVLAVCGGYQLLGSSYQMEDEELPGIGLVDLKTVREPGERLIGNCAIEVDLGEGSASSGAARVVAGFENHGGRTYLGDGERPLGRVLRGHGNNGRDGFEGVHRGNVIGTYLHGPLLPKNVWLADRLIELALGIELDPLPDDAMEEAAHMSARRAAGVG
jgi:lipid II isoglutaminyl synthase (glutamine-hydrolysing)